MKSESLQSHYPLAMKNIAERICAAEVALERIDRDPDCPDAWQIVELVALQIRKICELLILGSALAHFIEGKAKIDTRRWRPKEAFDQLNRLSDHPLQIPCGMLPEPDDNGASVLVPLSKPLPFHLLNKIYGLCGDQLHIPSAQKVINQSITPFDIKVYKSWTHGLRMLLRGHMLMLPERNVILICTWEGKADDMPIVLLLESSGQSNIEMSALHPFDLLEA